MSNPAQNTLEPAIKAEPDGERWAAILARDARQDHSFVYAVSTTGVYCRPSCAARQPLRRNVTFFASSSDARSAGFRACRRCHPDGVSPHETHRATVERACRTMDEAQPEDMPDLAALAHASGFSAFHFHRIFKAMMGVTPKAYADAVKAARLRTGLARTGSVTEAIYDAGYGSSSRFYEKADKALGMSATRFRAGGGGETIRFALALCTLGSILVAATGKGVCCVTLGDDPQYLLDDLQTRFPEADLLGGDAAFEDLVGTVVEFIEQPLSAHGLPLDLRGTAFQLRVWQALAAIPPGSVVTYSDIARAVGQPDAVRAVAGACAANPVAIAIPCHRVVRRDGSLSGYRWGVERKRALLAREGASLPGAASPINPKDRAR